MRTGTLVILCLPGLALMASLAGCQPQDKPPTAPATTGLPGDAYPYTHGNDRCKVCGEPLFHAIPRATSRQEIIAFAKFSKAFRSDKDALNGWIHPGIYCPNGCTEILIEFREPPEKASSGK